MTESDFRNQFPDGARCIYSRWEGYLEQNAWQDTKAAIEKADGQLIIGGTAENAGSLAFTGLVDDVALFSGIVLDNMWMLLALGLLALIKPTIHFFKD